MTPFARRTGSSTSMHVHLMRVLLFLLLAFDLFPAFAQSAASAAQSCDEGHVACARTCPRNSPQFAPCMSNCGRQKLECAALPPSRSVDPAPAQVPSARRGSKADSARVSQMMYSGACKAQSESCLAACNMAETRPDSKEGYSALDCGKRCKVAQTKCGIDAANSAP